jgi:hypothetical protein
MNKSLEYITNRIKSGNCNNITEEEFSNMRVIPFTSRIDGIEENKIIPMMRDPYKVPQEPWIQSWINRYAKELYEYNPDNTYTTLTYNPNADFDYFALETCYCDGTLYFVETLIKNIIHKIIKAKTCYSPALEKYPDGIDFNKHIVHYTVGDFVFNSWITDSPDSERPWMKDKFTVMLPIKFDIEEIVRKGQYE